MGVKVGRLGRRGLFEQGLLLEIGRDKTSSALVWVFLDQVSCDSARLIKDEAVVVLMVAMHHASVFIPISVHNDSRYKEPGRMAGTGGIRRSCVRV